MASIDLPHNSPETTAASQRDAVARRTLAHYELCAEAFEKSTRDHDVTQNYAALLGSIEGSPPFVILDFGCGPGRDLKYFRSLGHEATGLDGCARFVAMARQASGCEVLHQNFVQLRLPRERFHGVFANASLFHVPLQAIASVLEAIRESLVPRGVLFCSNPRGNDTEGFSDERYGVLYSLENWSAHVENAGFEEIAHYYRPSGRPRSEQPWLATVWRRR